MAAIAELLVREAIVVPEPANVPERQALYTPETAELAAQVKQKLGYTHLQDQIQNTSAKAAAEFEASQKAAVRQRNLALTMQQLEIEPFNIDSVRKYQEERKRLLEWNGDAQRAKVGSIANWCLTGAIVISLVITFFGHWRLGTSLMLAAVVFRGYFRPKSFNGEWAWQRFTFKQYSEHGKQVPMFILAKVLQIQEALPNAKFFIEELVFVPRPVVVYDDPFLVITCESCPDMYVEVWEEHAFESQIIDA
jgi:hypothetical protein